ncbi:MAG: HNH endonuclease [Planctomycetes bacterium]|nr:HNH endonuclease [Planctomycetota bacterium]
MSVSPPYAVALAFLIAFFSTQAGERLFTCAQLRRKVLGANRPPVFTEEELATEEWRILPTWVIGPFGTYFAVSNLGRVVRTRTGNGGSAGRVPTQRVGTNGYVTVSIGYAAREVHKLVAAAFIPNPLNLPQVHHKNGNPLDNRLVNLEWCSAKDNHRAACESGQMGRPDLRPACRLTRDDVSEIKSRKLFAREYAAKYGVHIRQIFRIWSGERWGNVG